MPAGFAGGGGAASAGVVALAVCGLSAGGWATGGLCTATNEDIEALQRLSGETSLPFLTIGGQKIKGHSDTEWTQFLDAAGYPATSKLPSNYRQPPAAPLVAVQRPPVAQPPAESPQTASATPAEAAPPPPANPAGIRF